MSPSAALLVLVVLGTSGAPAAGGTPTLQVRDGGDVAAGQLPDDPARPLLRSKCFTCHSGDYITQQRLTPDQWKRTVEKMRKFGAPMTDDEAELVASYLGRYWTVDLPEHRPAAVPAPRGAVAAPAKAR